MSLFNFNFNITNLVCDYLFGFGLRQKDTVSTSRPELENLLQGILDKDIKLKIILSELQNHRYSFATLNIVSIKNNNKMETVSIHNGIIMNEPTFCEVLIIPITNLGILVGSLILGNATKKISPFPDEIIALISKIIVE